MREINLSQFESWDIDEIFSLDDEKFLLTTTSEDEDEESNELAWS